MDVASGQQMPRPRKLILIASTGGHLAQLSKLRKRLNASDDSLWITFDSAQSRSLLKGRRVLYVPYVAPRDWRALGAAALAIRKVIRAERFDGAVSTGAGLALAGLGVARRYKIPGLYIESVSRVNGPSLTGRLLYISRLVTMRAQHESWVFGRWGTEPPVLADYATIDGPPVDGQLKVFVTLGTIRPYRFDGLVDALLETGLCGADSVWQLGITSRNGLPGQVHEYLTAEQFKLAAEEADVVVTHAGVGTVMDLFDLGICPVVVPRRAAYGEHVDEHQRQIVDLLSSLNLAEPVEVENLRSTNLRAAAGKSILGRL